MSDHTIVSFADPAFEDQLTELLRDGARRLVAKAVEAELASFLESLAEHTDEQGRRAVVRNGYQPERKILTGIGEVDVRMPKTRDRSGSGLRFRSSLVPPYLKKTRRLEEVIPLLYLAGVSTNDFDEALKALFGTSVKGLSPNTICRLKASWEDEYKAWRQRDWSDHRFIYLWADGIYINVRAEERRCMLVIIGCDAHGRKHFLAIEEGYRECKESWYAVLLKLRDRGVDVDPNLAVADGALGFWGALAEVFPMTRGQRCWVHKTANVLNKLPKAMHNQAKGALQAIYHAERRKDAEAAFDRFTAVYGAKYPKAVDCLEQDREALLAFYDFPAKHWLHIRSTNVIESTFGTIRLRTDKTRNCVSATTGLTLLFKVGMSAQKRWRRLRGFRQLDDIVHGIRFIDGVDERKISRKEAA